MRRRDLCALIYFRKKVETNSGNVRSITESIFRYQVFDAWELKTIEILTYMFMHFKTTFQIYIFILNILNRDIFLNY